MVADGLISGPGRYGTGTARCHGEIATLCNATQGERGRGGGQQEAAQCRRRCSRNHKGQDRAVRVLGVQGTDKDVGRPAGRPGRCWVCGELDRGALLLPAGPKGAILMTGKEERWARGAYRACPGQGSQRRGVVDGGVVAPGEPRYGATGCDCGRRGMRKLDSPGRGVTAGQVDREIRGLEGRTVRRCGQAGKRKEGGKGSF
jgi:hypothetical protein